jgi:hypothetical protein
MAITNEFDDAVKDASADLTTQIQAAEAVFKIGEDAEFYSDALAGGSVGPRDRQTVGVVDKTLALLGSDIDIESFIDTPRQINIGLDGGATIISGSFTFQEFWDEIFKTRNFFQDETPIRVETAIEELTNWYATIEEAESPGYADRVAEARSTIAELAPIRDDLRSSDDERRARGLQTYDPDALAGLLVVPEGVRIIDPSSEDASLRQTLQRVDADRPPAPAASSVRPTAPLGTQQRERLSLLEAEELEEEPRRLSGGAVLPGDDAIEQARLRALADRVRGRGDARASFEEGMAALRSRSASTPTTEVDTAAATVGFGNRATPEMLERFLTLPRTSESGAALGDEQAALTQLEEFSALTEAGVDATTAFNEVYGGQGTSGLGGTPQLTATQIRDANETEVYRILTERFGGFSFFLQKHDSRLQVGITVNGEIVEADDERADTVKNILDVMVERGIVDPGLIRGLVQKTEWWKTTDAKMREYDVLTADMSEPQKLEYLEPVLDLLREEAQYLGLDLDPQLARELAETITRFGEEGDIEFIRDTLVKEAEFNSAKATMSDFAAQRDRIVALSKKYFTPISADRAAGYAQEIYVGTKTMGQVEQIFKETIANTMPGLRNALDAGVTPDEYYAPYKYEIERMLGRPNIDLYEEFGDVIQHIPEGGGQARPMTLSELRRYVRGLPEWQQSTQGKDSARALAFAIGKTFGEVA